jgi:hypothetical protein
MPKAENGFGELRDLPVTSIRTAIVRALALIVLAVGLAVGIRADFRQFREALAYPPEVLFPQPLLEATAAAQRVLPSNVPAFYVCGDTDTWNCGLAQRLLYPRDIFCVRTTNAAHRRIFRELQRKFQIRYALGTGEPPPELRILRRTELTPTHWLAELAP